MNVLREAVASPSSRTLNMGSHLTGASESSDLGIRSSNVGERHRTRLPEGAWRLHPACLIEHSRQRLVYTRILSESFGENQSVWPVGHALFHPRFSLAEL